MTDPRTQAAAEAAWQVENAYRTRYGNNGTGTEWARFVADAEAALAAADACDAANGIRRVKVDDDALAAMCARWSNYGGMGNDRSDEDYTDEGCRTLLRAAWRDLEALLTALSGVPAHPKENP